MPTVNAIKPEIADTDLGLEGTWEMIFLKIFTPFDKVKLQFIWLCGGAFFESHH